MLRSRGKYKDRDGWRNELGKVEEKREKKDYSKNERWCVGNGFEKKIYEKDGDLDKWKYGNGRNEI